MEKKRKQRLSRKVPISSKGDHKHSLRSGKMSDLDKAIQIIREEILDSRTEIKNCTVASEARLLLKIEDLKNTVENLERENSEIKGELEYLKRAQNKKREEVVAEILCEDLRLAWCEPGYKRFC
ncbi:hypothetical protein JTB14_022956 [Gonioctena quinquepunctata]|nr:hypothetical protein JTB14_022956 [Gonioctena quinquepunctata]